MKRDFSPYELEEFGPAGENGRLTHIEGYNILLDGVKVCQVPPELLSQPRETFLQEIERLRQQ